MIEPLVLDAPEAAEALRMSESKVRKMMQRGELPAIHIGGNVRVPLFELKAWLDDKAKAAGL